MSKITESLTYEGCDLEAMVAATRYYQWLLSIVKPYIGESVVEVGAGSGSFSKQLLTIEPNQATFIEPTKNMYALLKEAVKENKPPNTKTVTYNNYLNDIVRKLIKQRPDTFIYVNVFEHIEDDAAELKTIYNLLPSGGHVIIFVPALQSLYSNFDEKIGHFRRYTKKSVTELAKTAGMEIREVRYMDMLGILPWWLSFKVMKRESLTPSLVGIYDSVCVPVVRGVESIIPAPFGKNVLLVARKN